jgi:hypothetical protein
MNSTVALSEMWSIVGSQFLALSGQSLEKNVRSPCLLAPMRRPAAGTPEYVMAKLTMSPGCEGEGSVRRSRSPAWVKGTALAPDVTAETVMPLPFSVSRATRSSQSSRAPSESIRTLTFACAAISSESSRSAIENE